MAEKTYDELSDFAVDFIVPSLEIQKIDITTEANQHGVLKVSYMAAKEVTPKDLAGLIDKEVKLIRTKDKKAVFIGICASIRTSFSFGCSIVELTALTNSVKCDRKKHWRIFQSDKKKLSEIAETVLKDCGGSLEIKPDITIPEIMIQQGETDFAFLKRIINLKKMNLFVSVNTSKISIIAGKEAKLQLRQLKDTIYNDIRYQRKNILGYARYKGMTDENAAVCNFLEDCFTVNPTEWQAGDTVSGSPEKIIVCSNVRSRYGILENRIVLRPKAGSVPDFEEGRDRLPVCLDAKVLAVQDKSNQIKVQYLINEEKNETEDNAVWINYEHDMSNYAYIMPDKGDLVHVYFDFKGVPAARDSRRTGKDDKEGTYESMKKEYLPSTKMLTNHNKMLRFTPEGLELTSDRSNYGEGAMIQFNDNKGVRIHSSKDINIKGKNISLDASSKVNIAGKNGVIIKVGSSVVKMEGDNISLKTVSLKHMATIPKAKGGTGKGCSISESDSFDSNNVMNFPTLNCEEKSISKASTLKKGGAGGSVSKKSMKSANDEKRKALNFQATKNKIPEWNVAFDSIK